MGADSTNKREIVIGLEIHIKLNTINKLFCQCENIQEFDDLAPNTHVCPICTGQPGALPVLNQEPLEKAIILWKALWCTIAPRSTFDRKSYFYPDLPMWFQITQLHAPTCVDGKVSFFTDNEFEDSTSVGIRDAHIENDTGKSVRENGKVMLDYNRAGTPLVEIVTNPDFRSAEEVIGFLKELQNIVIFNKVGFAELESGQMRVDVNLSLKKPDAEPYGTRVELKNMNSYSAIQRAIAHEAARQASLLEDSKPVDQETRRRDDVSKESFCMRSKEEAMDYRYMPEPDLPPITITKKQVEACIGDGIIAPYAIIERYKKELGFNKEYINALLADQNMLEFFEKTLADGHDPDESAKWLVGPVARWMNGEEKGFADIAFSYEQYADFLHRIDDGSLAWPQAKRVIPAMLAEWKDPWTIIKEKWLTPVDEKQIQTRIKELFTEKPDLRNDLASGNMKPIWFVIWQIMQKSWWAADPWTVRKLVMEIVWG